MARLPQMVKQKTGLADGTIDDEFKELNLTYVRIKQDTTKFLNECISYKAAMLSKYIQSQSQKIRDSLFNFI